MAAYFLPAHVHFCRRGDAFVFLDLRHDDYILVEGAASQALQDALSGQSSNAPARNLEAELGELLKSGLLVTEPISSRRIEPTAVDCASQPLLDPHAAPTGRIGPGHLAHFIAACTAAAISLRLRPIELVVRTVAQRKARQRPREPLDLERAQELTAVFNRLRLFFPFDYLCLYDSLALLNFLSKYRIFPNWVFGIKLEPWGAHCWVQDRAFIFNEGPEEAATYTPIMAI